MSRKNIILLSIIALLVILILIRCFGQGEDSLKWKALEDETDRIVITSQTNRIEFKKSEEKWYIQPQGYLAATDTIKRLSEHLLTNREFALTSSHPVHAKYELDEAKRIHATLYKGEKELRSLIIGKAASTYRHTYVSIPGDNNIYRTSGNFRNDFNRKVDDLRDKKVVSFDKESLISLTMTAGSGQKMTIKQDFKAPDFNATNAPPPSPDQKVWTDDQGRELKEREVNDILNSLSALNCSAFLPDDLESLQKEKAAVLFEIKTAEKTITLAVLRVKDGDDYRAWTSERKFGFKMAKYLGERLDKPFSALLK